MAPFGGPVGVVGVGIDVAPIPYVSLTAGAGLGLASRQWAVAIRPRVPITSLVSVQATAGYSRGDYTHFIQLDFAGAGVTEAFSEGSWVNADLGAEIRFRSGFFLRPFFGMSKLVGCSRAEHSDYYGTSIVPKKDWPVLPYMGLGLGYAFGVD